MKKTVGKKIIESIAEEINRLSTQKEFVLRHKSKETDFIRERKLSFSSVVKFVMSFSNTSLDFERTKLIHASGIENISNAALCKARNKVNYSAFRELLIRTQQLIPNKRKYKGYGVIAIDGMKGELPNTPELQKYRQKND